MRIAFFDCFAGISGDMTVGALLDAGLEFDHLRAELSKLELAGYRIERTRTKRHHISATKFDVFIEDEVPYHVHRSTDESHAHEHHDDASAQSGDHDHPHEHTHDDAHRREREHGAQQAELHSVAGSHEHDGHAGHVHRRLRDVLAVVRQANLSPWVTEHAVEVFTRLAGAESRMHDMPVDEVHFHEVGAVDAIIDIVGACIGLEALGIERVFSSPIRTGTGTIRAAHGVMPVPAPGTLELLRGVPIEHTALPYELVTPTGAAIITTFASAFGPPPPFVAESVGYGAGGRDPKEIANLLRVEIGETVGKAGEERGIVVETTIDDMTPEVYGYIMERLLKTGAKDVYLAPVIMKKNRPGTVVHVLTDAQHHAAVLAVLFSETSTLGVRSTDVVRTVLPRRGGKVQTPWGSIRVKYAEWNGKCRVTPEYDDCAAIARQHGVPILEVYECARKAVQ